MRKWKASTDKHNFLEKCAQRLPAEMTHVLTQLKYALEYKRTKYAFWSKGHLCRPAIESRSSWRINISIFVVLFQFTFQNLNMKHILWKEILVVALCCVCSFADGKCYNCSPLLLHHSYINSLFYYFIHLFIYPQFFGLLPLHMSSISNLLLQWNEQVSSYRKTTCV